MIFTMAYMVERCRRLMSGGFPNDTDRTQDGEIRIAVGSVASKVLQSSSLNMQFGFDGEKIPDGAIISTYEKVPVSRGLGNTSTAKLPVTPINMPNRMGVFAVYPTGYPEREYMAIPPGVYNQVKVDQLINPLCDGLYTWSGPTVTIYDDLIGAGITSIDLQLCVMDWGKYGDNDILPISPDQEIDIINGVLQLYGHEPNYKRDNSDQPPSTAN